MSATTDMPEADRPRVLYLQYTNPAAYPPICHSARILAAEGFDVTLLGTTGSGDALQFSPEPRVQVALMPVNGAAGGQKLHYARFATWAYRWALRWKPSWVYVSDVLAAPIGLALRDTAGIRTIYHEHDTPDAGAPSLFVRAALAARSRLAKRADLCVLPNAQRAETFAQNTGRADVLTVWNCPMRDEIAGRPRSMRSPLQLLYHGSIVPARLPATVIEAIAQLSPRVTLTVAGYETVGHRGYLAHLEERAAALGVAGSVQFAGTIPTRSDLMAHCRQFDVGLALLFSGTCDPNERQMVGASNKPFDYLAGGLGLLVGDLPDWRATYVDAGLARACDAQSSDSIATALEWFCDHPEETAAMGERGRRKIEAEWNYEQAFAPVLRHMLTVAG